MHDLQPEGSALFGAEPSFRSDFSLDPEEARAQAASRRASRMQSREASVAPVESLGSIYLLCIYRAIILIIILYPCRSCSRLR